MAAIIYFISLILQFISFALIIWIILSWLISFGVINAHQPIVYRVNDALNRLFEPMLRPIRQILPPTGAIDFSPLVLFALIKTLQFALNYYF